MGRHTGSDQHPPTTAARTAPGARRTAPAAGRTAAGTVPDAVAALPGWGLFATAVAAVTLRATGGSWAAVDAVALLGAATTWTLWWTAGTAEQLRRRPAHQAGAAARPAPASGGAATADAPGAPRRVTP